MDGNDTSSFQEAGEKAGAAADSLYSQVKFDMPEAVRSFAEQGLSQTREAYGRMKAATEEATGMIEDSFENTRANLRDFQLKAIDTAKANADAGFELARKLLGASSVAEAVQLQSTFARERFEAMVDASKDMQGLISKAGTEAAKPAKAMFERSMSAAKDN